MSKKIPIYSGGEETNREGLVASNKAGEKSAFIENISSSPESIMPVSREEESYLPPQGAALPHIRHFDYLNRVAEEIGSRIGDEDRYAGDSLRHARAAHSTAVRELSNHVAYHNVNERATAYKHLQNAGDALHDSILHIQEAERKNGVPEKGPRLSDNRAEPLLDNERGTPISLETKPGKGMGIFQRIASVVNDYGNRVLGAASGTTDYNEKKFATQIGTTPRGRSRQVAQSPVVTQEKPAVEARAPQAVLTARVDPTTTAAPTHIDPLPAVPSPPIPAGMTAEDHEAVRVKAFRHWMKNDETIQWMGGIKELTKPQRDGMFADSKAATDPHGYFADVAEQKNKKDHTSFLEAKSLMAESSRRDREREADKTISKTQGRKVAAVPGNLTAKEIIKQKAQSRLDALRSGAAEKETEQVPVEDINTDTIDSKIDTDNDYDAPASLAVASLTRSKHLSGFLDGKEDGNYQDV